MKNSRLFAGAGGLALLLPVHAAAGFGPPLVREAVVQHGDIDLDTPAGAEVMLSRLDDAASEACGGHPGPLVGNYHFATAIRREFQRCRITAIDMATLRLGAPAVRAAWLLRPEAAQGERARQRSAELLRAQAGTRAGAPEASGESRSGGQ